MSCSTVVKEEPSLPDSHDNFGEPSPLVSIVIPAKDEERNLERTVRSILSSDHDRLELILVDDRSSDRTREIMSQLAAEDPRIKVLAILDLPNDWTGKTHAMYKAADQATGEILLFSDADAVLSPSTLSKTLRFMSQERLDVLCLLPGFTERDLAGTCVPASRAWFFVFPSSVRGQRPKQAHGHGFGCFIMTRKQAYDQVGTWKRFRQEITEDVAFSRAVKAAGLKMRLLRGAAFVRTEPFGGVGAVLPVLEENLLRRVREKHCQDLEIDDELHGAHGARGHLLLVVGRNLDVGNSVLGSLCAFPCFRIWLWLRL